MPLRTRPAPRVLLRAALALSAAGAALTGGAGAAQALQVPPTQEAVDGAVTGVEAGVAPIGHLQVDPLANTGVDPLANSAGTQVADFRPVSTAAVTKPLTDGASLGELPGATVGSVLHG